MAIVRLAETMSHTQSPIPSGLILSNFRVHLGRGWLTAETALVRRINTNDANGYYKALGVSPSATREEIKAAYRSLVKKLHPDLNPGRPDLEELFKYVTEIVSVLLDSEERSRYDSVSGEAVYLGSMEREELARNGVAYNVVEKQVPDHFGAGERHWACLTDSGFLAGQDTDSWVELCREVSPAVGYRGRLRVGVLEGGRNWPCEPDLVWGIFTTGFSTFVIFQRGVEPNRLHALCAMIEWQSHLQKQVQQKRA